MIEALACMKVIYDSEVCRSRCMHEGHLTPDSSGASSSTILVSTGENAIPYIMVAIKKMVL